MLVNELTQRGVHRRFIDSGLLHMAADAEQLRPAVLLGSELGEPLGAVRDDRWQVAERLDVVDRGRAVVETRHRGKGRLDPRLRPLAFERLDERGLLAGLVGAGAAMNHDVAVEAAAHDVLAGIPLCVRLRELRLEHLLDVIELAADVDVGDLRADRPAADQAALEEQVRVPLHEHVILERARLALVRVARDVLREWRVLQYELPLQSGWEPCPATAAKSRSLDDLDDVLRLSRQRLLQAQVALVLQIEVQREAVRLADVFGEDWIHVDSFCVPGATDYVSFFQLLAGPHPRSL